MSVKDINSFIQDKLVKEGLDRISAVDAASWLDEVGLLGDSESKPGLPLRKMLRDGLIVGAHQQANKRWFIYRKR